MLLKKFILLTFVLTCQSFNLINNKLPKYLEYWNDPRIHNLGNNNLLHAIIAPISTKLIDILSYNQINVRKKILERIPENKRVLDLGCGVGYSTKENQLGIDTSKNMINLGRLIHPNKNFKFYNIEDIDQLEKFDIITCMFTFHEIPQSSRINIIQKSLMMANEKVIIVDISPQKIPSKLMLSGEPYLNEYLTNIDQDLKNYTKSYELIKNHVKIWEFNI